MYACKKKSFTKGVKKCVRKRSPCQVNLKELNVFRKKKWHSLQPFIMYITMSAFEGSIHQEVKFQMKEKSREFEPPAWF